MMMFWWATALAALGPDIKLDLDRIEDTFNMKDGVSPYENDLAVIAPTLFQLSLDDDPELTDTVKGMFIGMFVGDTLTSKESVWSVQAERALCMAASLLVLGEINPADQAQRYTQCLARGYLACVFPRTDPDLLVPAFEKWRQGVIVNYLAETASPIPALDAPELRFQGRRHRGYQPLYARLTESYVLPYQFRYNFMVRLAPLVIFGRRRSAQQVIDAVMLLSRSDNALFGAHEACRLLTLLLWGLAQGRSKADVLSASFCEEHRVVLAIPENSYIWKIAMGSYRTYTETIHDDIPIFGENRPPPTVFGARNTTPAGRIEAALWVLTHDGGSFGTGMEMVPALGGATKDVAMVYGMLAGACYGFSGIPETWRTTLYKSTFLEQVAVLLKAREGRSLPLPLPSPLTELPILNSGTDLHGLAASAPGLFEAIRTNVDAEVLDRRGCLQNDPHRV